MSSVSREERDRLFVCVLSKKWLIHAWPCRDFLVLGEVMSFCFLQLLAIARQGVALLQNPREVRQLKVSVCGLHDRSSICASWQPEKGMRKAAGKLLSGQELGLPWSTVPSPLHTRPMLKSLLSLIGPYRSIKCSQQRSKVGNATTEFWKVCVCVYARSRVCSPVSRNVLCAYVRDRADALRQSLSIEHLDPHLHPIG